ncbi:MAG TPA: endonuclease III [Coprothermobacter sp.]|nr:endonuclease III [Coprothermobacter sp.]
MELQKVVKILSETHQNGLHFDLQFDNAYQLLIAALLAAQASDESVNEITKEFFRRFPSPETVAEADVEALEKAIYPVNFYKTKAKRLKECCQVLVEKYHGEVPSTVEELTKLPGVGKKTASMVILGAFGQPAVVVDRHVLRVLSRLGFEYKDADTAEEEIRQLLPPEYWGLLSYSFMRHGKTICLARKPLCEKCPLKDCCPSSTATASDGDEREGI